MRSVVVPLSYGLIVASFMLSQIHLATAACTNTTTYVEHSLETYESWGLGEVKTHLDFISCPSSGNVSCTLPPTSYTVTIAPQFNISNTTNVSFDDLDWKGVDALEDASQVLDLPLNSSDRKAIIGYMDEFWPPGDPERRWHLALSPLTVTLTSKNISHYANLTVEPGYNMTLTYIAFRATNWVRFTQCENKSLDGQLIGAMMPYYRPDPALGDSNNPNSDMRIAATFIVDKQFLNDSVPDTNDGSGVGLKAGSSWATTLIVLGVLAINWL